MASNREHVRNFICDAYTVPELQRIVLDWLATDSPALATQARDHIAWNRSSVDVAEDLLLFLERQGLADGLRDALLASRPGRQREIEALWAPHDPSATRFEPRSNGTTSRPDTDGGPAASTRDYARRIKQVNLLVVIAIVATLVALVSLAVGVPLLAIALLVVLAVLALVLAWVHGRTLEQRAMLGWSTASVTVGLAVIAAGLWWASSLPPSASAAGDDVPRRDPPVMAGVDLQARAGSELPHVPQRAAPTDGGVDRISLVVLGSPRHLAAWTLYEAGMSRECPTPAQAGTKVCYVAEGVAIEIVVGGVGVGPLAGQRVAVLRVISQQGPLDCRSEGTGLLRCRVIPRPDRPQRGSSRGMRLTTEI